MKDVITDANFPRTKDQRVYHLGFRVGEVANRIVTVGSPSRAESIAKLLQDEHPYRISSDRGFLTITGRYKGVPVSIVSIGMGHPNMDFFVREARECVSGDMAVIRLGSCGGLIGLPVGSLVVPTASVSVSRNVDFDFSSHAAPSDDLPYRISKSAPADPELHSKLVAALTRTLPNDLRTEIKSDIVNASADSFYSSQGRQTSFPDHNEGLIEHLLESVPNLGSLEMETFHLLHLASVWRPRLVPAPADDAQVMPPTTGPVAATVTPHAPTVRPSTPSAAGGRIRAAAVQMIFASRTSQDFITPEHVEQLEAWSGRGVLEALVNFPIPEELLHEENGSVWTM